MKLFPSQPLQNQAISESTAPGLRGRVVHSWRGVDACISGEQLTPAFMASSLTAAFLASRLTPAFHWEQLTPPFLASGRCLDSGTRRRGSFGLSSPKGGGNVLKGGRRIKVTRKTSQKVILKSSHRHLQRFEGGRISDKGVDFRAAARPLRRPHATGWTSPSGEAARPRTPRARHDDTDPNGGKEDMVTPRSGQSNDARADNLRRMQFCSLGRRPASGRGCLPHRSLPMGGFMKAIYARVGTFARVAEGGPKVAAPLRISAVDLPSTSGILVVFRRWLLPVNAMEALAFAVAGWMGPHGP
jgi:hypothetical protein